MASAFELNTLAEIAILNIMVGRIFTHLAKASPDPRSFLATELCVGFGRPRQHQLLQRLEIAKTRYGNHWWHSGRLVEIIVACD